MPLYALGSNASHQLSFPHTDDIHTPAQTSLSLPPGSKPVKIVAGSNHTLLLTNEGAVYATGANHKGQCFVKGKDVLPGFERVGEVKRWRDVGATWEGSILIDSEGAIWSCGRIRNHENLDGKSFAELVGGNGEGEVKVAAGVQHFILFDDTVAIGFGDGSKRQFSTPASGDGVKLPTSDIRQVTCGKEFTCILSSTGAVSIYTSSTKHSLHAIPPLPPKIISMASSWSTIVLLTEKGYLHAWGRHDRAQFPPPDLPPLSSLSAGSEHFLAISVGKVFTWGWNEHGNCDLETLKDVNFVHEISVPANERAVYVAGGCGTSWIWTEARC
jgi:protein ATS1